MGDEPGEKSQVGDVDDRTGFKFCTVKELRLAICHSALVTTEARLQTCDPEMLVGC